MFQNLTICKNSGFKFVSQQTLLFIKNKNRTNLIDRFFMRGYHSTSKSQIALQTVLTLKRRYCPNIFKQKIIIFI